MKTPQIITCDACGKDITATGNCMDYRLALVCESIPPYGDTVTVMHISKPINQDKHFCGISCLHKWTIDSHKYFDKANEELETLRSLAKAFDGYLGGTVDRQDAIAACMSYEESQTKS